MPVAVLLTVAGLQVPLIPLLEVNGRIGARAPEQIGGMAVNVGAMFGLTVTVKLPVVAH